MPLEGLAMWSAALVDATELVEDSAAAPADVLLRLWQLLLRLELCHL
jgi:hypothetical protein